MFRKALSLLAVSLPYITGLSACTASPVDDATLKTIYGTPLPKLERPLNIFHLGHSLVGKNMPAMLQQLGGTDSDYRSQLGWGSPLRSHWDPDIPINGFEAENAHSRYQDVFNAIDSQKYDALVLTESVEIKDAIKYQDSALYLSKFANFTDRISPNTRIYLYETWHQVTDKTGWINRLNADYSQYWLDKILDPAIQLNSARIPIYIIPAGQVMSAFFTELKSNGGFKRLSKPEDIFAKNKDGSLDPIHLNDMGNYLVALVHYAVLYQKSPAGLPYQLKLADGSTAVSPSKEAAELMQSITWKVVSNDYRTGLTGYINE